MNITWFSFIEFEQDMGKVITNRRFYSKGIPEGIAARELKAKRKAEGDDSSDEYEKATEEDEELNDRVYELEEQRQEMGNARLAEQEEAWQQQKNKMRAEKEGNKTKEPKNTNKRKKQPKSKPTCDSDSHSEQVDDDQQLGSESDYEPPSKRQQKSKPPLAITKVRAKKVATPGAPLPSDSDVESSDNEESVQGENIPQETQNVGSGLAAQKGEKQKV